MATVIATEAGISALSTLSNVSPAPHSTVLSGTLHLTSISLLNLGSSFSRCCTPMRVRVPRTLLPLSEPGLLTDAKIFYVVSMDGICLILRLRPRSITNHGLDIKTSQK